MRRKFILGIKKSLVLCFVIVTLVSINFAMAADNVSPLKAKFIKIDKSVEVMSKSKTVEQSKEEVISPEYTIIQEHGKSYHPRYVRYNEDEVSSKAKCSCGKKSYSKFHTTKFQNYCVLCKKSGKLIYRPHFEGEWTCNACGADYCLATGKEKYSWSRKVLKQFKDNTISKNNIASN